MKRLLLFFVLLLSLLANPVWAANWYPHTFVELQAQSNSASPGDTIWLDGSTSYSGTLTAKAGNTLRPVVYVGADLTTPSSTLTGLTPASHTRFYGLKITNELKLGSRARVVIDHCDLLSNLNYEDADSSSVRSTLVRGSTLYVNRYKSAGGSNSAVCDTLEWCNFTGLSATSGFAIAFGNTEGPYYVSKFVQRFNQFAISQSGSTAWTPAKHWFTSEMLSYANKFTITSTASAVGSNEGNFISMWRDSSHTLTMKRDTILVDNGSSTISSTSYGLMTASGLGGAYATSCTGYSIDSCYIRMVRGSPMYFQAQIAGGKVRYNVLRSRMSTALELGSAFSHASNDPYFHHNTIIGPQAVYFSDQAGAGKFTNNILYGTSSATCSDFTAVGGSNTAISVSDSNLVYSTTGDSSRAFSRGACASPRTGAWASAGNDTHSSWASPQFTDTTWASLNVQPAAGSLAFSNKWTLGYAGAQYTSTVPLSITVTADVKSTTAGLVANLAGDVDTTATVSATLDGVVTATWYRIPYTTKWATSLFGLTPGASATLVVTATRGAETVTSTSTVTARAENWWQQPVKGPLVWIAPTGNDTTGTGTYAAPYRTINKGWAILKAKPNYGKGGGVALQAGTYYSTGYLDGAEGYATPDSMYHLLGEAGALVSGADENVVAANLTWTATGINGVYKARYLTAGSIGTIVVGSTTLHKCTTRTEILTGAGTGVAGAWSYNAYSWYSNGTDSLYVRTNGSAPSGTMYIAIRPNLVYLLDKYIRVHGISFQFAGGATGNGIALHVGTAGATTYNASGAVIDSCSFLNTTREAIYAFSGAEGNSDSVVVADCTFNSSAYVMGYKATKGRLEESMTPIGADGSSWMVTRNTMSGWGGGLHHNGGATWGSTLTNDWDICDNTISLMGDDAIEFDGAYARNHKLYRNTINGCNNAISLAPIYGGPAFILYNQIRGYNYWDISSGAFKLGTGGLGTSCGQALIANNTCFGDSLADHTAAYSVFDVGEFSNKHFFNNIFQSKAASIYTLLSTYWATCELDYNLHWSTANGTSAIQLDDGVGTLYGTEVNGEGFELHGILGTHPAWADTGTTLRATAGVNRGVQLPGISGKIITLVGAPDIGATEYSPPSAVASRRKHWLSVWLGLLKRPF